MKGRKAFYLAIVIWLLLILCCIVRAWHESAEAMEEVPMAVVDDGRLPGDDVTATVRCYMTPEEIQEDYENYYIEAALLAKAHRIDNATVTHYDCCKKCCGNDKGITASGRKAVPYVSVAVDPNVIPLGSDVLVDYGDGVIEYYRADDTGSGVYGNHIDLCVESHATAIQLGVRQATVYWI